MLCSDRRLLLQRATGLCLWLLFIIPFPAAGQNATIEGRVTWASNNKPVEGAEVGIPATTNAAVTGDYGRYTLTGLKPGKYKVKVFLFGYQTATKRVSLKASETRAVNFRIDTLSEDLEGITVQGEDNFNFGVRNLRPVEDMGIYSGRKSKVVKAEQIQGNVAFEKGRQLFNKVAGLNVWESDGAGLQLDVGSRGLNPKRTSNFNTRQNGYDIAADALGYPETYYTPPTQALQQIEIIRGASSLQYGPQFGGMINFELKDPPADEVFRLNTEQSIMGFQLFDQPNPGPVSSYTSVSGTSESDKWSYFGYYKYKQGSPGDGNTWRPNSEFRVHNSFAATTYRPTGDLSISLELTKMNYLAQQPGGLTDRLFEEDPSQSIRSRNWFRVDWNMAALKVDYRISDQLKLNLRNFGMAGGRASVGHLGRIDRADPGAERNLLKDNYRNFGNETRLLYNYEVLGQQSALLLGSRYYNGRTEREQGFGSDGSGADFTFTELTDCSRTNCDRSSFTFPSRNISIFGENKLSLTPELTITPGFRFEHIQTESDGTYENVNIDRAGNIFFRDTIDEQRSRTRNFVLFGLGLSYKPSPYFQAYGNFSQNYRAISFNDMRIINPNLEVDKQLKDEQGYTGDIGARGQMADWLTYDISLFGISYQDKIGAILKRSDSTFQTFRFRTNIADALHYGVEAFAEVDLLKIGEMVGANPGLRDGQADNTQLSLYTNFSWLSATYTNSDEPGIEGNQVEYAPPVKFRTGLNLRKGSFSSSFQFSYISQHYSDATNAEKTLDAVHGVIPGYTVMDVSAAYEFEPLTVKLGINNLMDQRYFTRRSTGYPGPGIIPAQVRSGYLTLKAQF